MITSGCFLGPGAFFGTSIGLPTSPGFVLITSAKVMKLSSFLSHVSARVLESGPLFFFCFQTSHRGWSTSQKHVQNPLNPRGIFFAGCQNVF